MTTIKQIETAFQKAVEVGKLDEKYLKQLTFVFVTNLGKDIPIDLGNESDGLVSWHEDMGAPDKYLTVSLDQWGKRYVVFDKPSGTHEMNPVYCYNRFFDGNSKGPDRAAEQVCSPLTVQTARLIVGVLGELTKGGQASLELGEQAQITAVQKYLEPPAETPPKAY